MITFLKIISNMDDVKSGQVLKMVLLLIYTVVVLLVCTLPDLLGIIGCI